MAVLFPLVVLVAAEVFVLVEVARQIGVLAAVLLLLATSVFGPMIVRRAGFGVWRRARARLDRGEVPGREAIDGLLLLTAGLLICIPGFLTDALGLLLLLPPVRAAARSAVTARLLRRARLAVTGLRGGSGGLEPAPVPGGGWPRVRGRGGPIEAESHEVVRPGPEPGREPALPTSDPPPPPGGSSRPADGSPGPAGGSSRPAGGSPGGIADRSVP